MFNTKSENPNYLAFITQLKEPRKHSNADKLLCWNVQFNNTITNLDYFEGQIVVYFPLECAINKSLLSFINAFSDKELNNDKEIKGFFANNARVKAIKLRGEKSEGYILPLDTILAWLESLGKSFKKENYLPIDLVNKSFDSFDDILIVEKYQIATKNIHSNSPKQKVARESKIVENQFRFHPDTAQFKRNIDKINPEDEITIGYKIHGCVDANTILTTKEFGDLTIKEIVSQKLRVHVQSLDIQSNSLIFAEVTDFFQKEDSGIWYEIEMEDGSFIQATDNHPFWLDKHKCYRQLKELKIGDNLTKIT